MINQLQGCFFRRNNSGLDVLKIYARRIIEQGGDDSAQQKNNFSKNDKGNHMVPEGYHQFFQLK